MKRSMVISLIGRPNVGKSSIFNRLMNSANKAITYDRPGVTRDRHYGIANFSDLKDEMAEDCILVDTGGFYPEQLSLEGKNQDEINAKKFFNIMTDHAKLAINESDLVLFVVDVREGLIPFDEAIVRYLRTQKKPFWLVMNKYDSDGQMGDEVDFYNLGIDYENMFKLSASHGLGIETLRERIHEQLIHFANSSIADAPELTKGVAPREEVVSRVAIVGSPNAGKSTLLNKLVGSERALVSDIAGTTVDPIEGFFDLYFGKDIEGLRMDSRTIDESRQLLDQYTEFRRNNAEFSKMLQEQFEQEGGDFDESVDQMVDADDTLEAELKAEDEAVNEKIYEEVFNQPEVEDVEDESYVGSLWRSIHIVDTAGIRKHKAIESFVEEQSVFRALRSITEAEVVVFMIDGTKGISHQDRRLLDIAEDKGKSIIICLNKSDLLREKLKDEKAKREWIEDVRYTIPWLDHCAIIPISAKFNKGIGALKKELKRTIITRRKTVPTGLLNRLIYELLDRHPVSINGTKRLKIKYSSMIKANPPTFILFSNLSKGIPDSYKKYLKKSLRAQFGFYNTPVHLIFRTGKDLEQRMRKVKN